MIAKPSNTEQVQAISARLWSSGYLPGEHAAVSFRTSGDPILFIAQRRSPLVSNDLFFSDKGVKVELAELEKMSESLTWYQEPDKKVN